MLEEEVDEEGGMIDTVRLLTRAMARQVRHILYLAVWQKAGLAFRVEYQELEEEQGCVAMAPGWMTTLIP